MDNSEVAFQKHDKFYSPKDELKYPLRQNVGYSLTKCVG